jgi:hypothetical protein
LIAFILLTFALSACASQSASSTATAVPIVVEIAATATSPATAAPTATAVPAATATPAATDTSAPAPTAESTPTQQNTLLPVAAGAYQPVSAEVCQVIREDASNAISTSFTLQEDAPFTDTLSGETGQGCDLTATGTGADFAGPDDVITKLTNAFVGWSEKIDYQAGGPTGAATGMTRDMGLLLISANWTPAEGANCPSDQPISACDLQPSQKLYTIQIQVAQK